MSFFFTKLRFAVLRETLISLIPTEHAKSLKELLTTYNMTKCIVWKPFYYMHIAKIIKAIPDVNLRESILCLKTYAGELSFISSVAQPVKILTKTRICRWSHLKVTH